MACEHAGCSLNIFSTCANHCRKSVCLEHLIEHGDMFLRDFTNLIDHLDKSTCSLMQEANNAATQIAERRQDETERVNRQYDQQQEAIRIRLAFVEAANALLKEKQMQLTKSKEENECHIAQHDLEQIKSYAIEIKKYSLETQEKPIANNEITTNASRTYSCPLTRTNVFGITLEHNMRLDCDGSDYIKYSLTKHFEYYHRMLPEYAVRLRNAIIDDQLSPDTKLFSANEIIVNQEYRVDCPLTDPTNIYGARSNLSRLPHIPCMKKQLVYPSMLNHFHLYHKMKYDVARTLSNAMKDKSLHPDLILFGKDQRLGTTLKRK